MANVAFAAVDMWQHRFEVNTRLILNDLCTQAALCPAPPQPANLPHWREMLGTDLVTDPVSGVSYDLRRFKLEEAYASGRRVSYDFNEIPAPGQPQVYGDGAVTIFLPRAVIHLDLLWRG